MKVNIIKVGVYESNCYVVMDENSKEAIVIDPGDNFQTIKGAIERMDAKVKYILLTHGHADHTSAAREIKEYTKAQVCINKKDYEFMEKKEAMFGEIENLGKVDKFICENDVFKIGDINIKCIETPGHTPGGMSFLIQDLLFTGDTLFSGSIGRTDFPGGDFDQLLDSIKTKIMINDERTMILPGHGIESSIDQEAKYNPFF